MPSLNKVAVYFVASPLQYLAARQIAAHFERDARQVLVWYQPGVRQAVVESEWDACTYMPWPRHQPLPGPFGRHRRLRENVQKIAELIGPCDELILHSAVYDTEAINYFLKALPARCGARRMHARILPDGLISIRRYPLSAAKQLLQRLRLVRRLFAPELQYWSYSGDRIGSDAPFCDRIYVLPGLPHDYPLAKVQPLPPFASRQRTNAGAEQKKRALVVGQPLAGAGLVAKEDSLALTARIHAWLRDEGIDEVDYKAHPKDPDHELRHAEYRLIEPQGVLESYLASTDYDVVIGVRSSALLFARFIYQDKVRILSFGWNRVRFKSEQEKKDMTEVFGICGVELVE